MMVISPIQTVFSDTAKLWPVCLSALSDHCLRLICICFFVFFCQSSNQTGKSLYRLNFIGV